ncbi:hypothetical protein SDC9_81995 [bioreactor metagenome]|uniref:Sulfatase N-terminal domain-containing protein n=1 Tax=bioreactor metagenome TaxID=1076179 RepID=A0A644ZBZ0_9ZZZZ|nr:sulfatase [Erysipelotrichaceae bacterium]
MRTIIIFNDTMKRNYLTPYNPNSDVIAPNLTAFSHDSVTFDNHFVGSMPCMPARRDLMTGRLNFLERSWGPIEIYDQTLPELLFKSGIRSHIITDHAHYFRLGGENYCQAYNTFEFFRGQESDQWVSLIDDPAMPTDYFGLVKRQYECNRIRFKEEKDYPSVKCFAAAKRWIQENKNAQDFLLTIETFDPHEPFDLPQKYLDLYQDNYTGPRFDLPKYHQISEETPEAINHLVKRYKGLVTMTDKHFGSFIDELKKNHMYDDTMIIVTTDHGFFLGERQLLGKSFMHSYNEIANIPLMIHLPKHAFHGERRRAITQNIDIMPTILDYAGINQPEACTGRSLRSVFENDRGRPYALYGTFGAALNFFNGQYTYFKAPDYTKPLFEYTTALTTIRGWLGKNQADQIQLGHFLPHVPYPVYRVPAANNALISDFRYLQKSLLFDIQNDYEQQNDLLSKNDCTVFDRLLRSALKENNAPCELIDRFKL